MARKKSDEDLLPDLIDDGEALEAGEDEEEFVDDDEEEEAAEVPVKPKPAPPPRVKAKTTVAPPKEPLGDEVLGLTADVPVQVVAVLGKKSIAMRDLLKLHMGDVIDLGRPASEAVDLVASGKLLAKGELVEIDGRLGVRIVKMLK